VFSVSKVRVPRARGRALMGRARGTVFRDLEGDLLTFGRARLKK
jgi:hypothetical protein